MALILGLLNLVLIILAIVSLIWSIIGVPLGIFYLLRYLTTKNGSYKKKLPKRIVLSFVGLIVLVVLPIVWGLINFLGVSLGGGMFQSGGGLKPLGQ